MQAYVKLNFFSIFLFRMYRMLYPLCIWSVLILLNVLKYTYTGTLLGTDNFTYNRSVEGGYVLISALKKNTISLLEKRTLKLDELD